MEENQSMNLEYISLADTCELSINDTFINMFQTADDIFNEKNYEKEERNNKIKYYLTKDDEDLVFISFNLKTEKVIIDCIGEALDIDVIRAIYLKMRELNWR